MSKKVNSMNLLSQTKYAIISETPLFNTNSLADIRKVALARGCITIKERLARNHERIMFIESADGKVVNVTTGICIPEGGS
jgi:hypothetical protein